MKRVFLMIVTGLTLCGPVLANAQVSDGHVSRAQVEAQVAAAERDGTLHGSKVHYPSQQGSDTAYGGAPDGRSAAGIPAPTPSVSAVPSASPIQHH